MISAAPALDEFRTLVAGFRNGSLAANIIFYAVMKPDRLGVIRPESASA